MSAKIFILNFIYFTSFYNVTLDRTTNLKVYQVFTTITILEVQFSLIVYQISRLIPKEINRIQFLNIVSYLLSITTRPSVIYYNIANLLINNGQRESACHISPFKVLIFIFVTYFTQALINHNNNNSSNLSYRHQVILHFLFDRLIICLMP